MCFANDRFVRSSPKRYAQVHDTPPESYVDKCCFFKGSQKKIKKKIKKMFVLTHRNSFIILDTFF